jgi:hypothetical protein
MTADCRRGTLEAAYTIMTSTEARQRWNDDPSDLAGMLYAGLLQRAPDEEGLQTSIRSIRGRGLGWATTEMLASPEYNGRLGALCAGQSPSEARMLTWADTVHYVDQVLLPKARAVAVICGVDAVAAFNFGTLGEALEAAGGQPPEPTAAEPRPRDKRSAARRALGWFGGKLGHPVVELTQAADEHLLNGTGGERECAASRTMVETARHITDLAASHLDGPTGGDNAVFLSTRSTRTGWTADDDRFLHRFDLTVGPTPADVRVFSGEVRDKDLALGPLAIG